MAALDNPAASAICSLYPEMLCPLRRDSIPPMGDRTWKELIK